MTRQEMFDKAYTAIIAQGEPAYDNVICLYRLVKGNGSILKCAFGHFIPDDQYKEEFEGKSAAEVNEVLHIVPEEDYLFINALQQVHDNAACVRPTRASFLDVYKEKMKNLAANYGLIFSENQ